MRVLVTGGTGFVGHYVLDELQEAGHETLVLHEHDTDPGIQGTVLTGNILDAAHMRQIVHDTRPDGCIHLAGIAFVPLGWSDPELVFRVNVLGTTNMLDAFRHEKPDAAFVMISSSQIYGHAPRPLPIRESDPPTPDNLYALSKLTGDLMTLLYHERYGMRTMSARPCNHIGPGQSESFVVPSFARQLVEMRGGTRDPVIRVGNLDSTREFLDVRDVARGYRLILEKGVAGSAYNLASKQHFSIRAILDLLIDITGVHPEIIIDPDRFRPTDSQPVLDISRIAGDTGWSPQYTLEQSLRDVIESMSLKAPSAGGTDPS